MSHPHYLSWQVDWPLFVKVPFDSEGRTWQRGEHYPWRTLGINGVKEQSVARLYNSGYLYHNPDLEKETKVGDRLNEMTNAQLETLVGLLNAEVKSKTQSVTEFNAKKCKLSKIESKQRGLVRSFLRNNSWVEEKFYEIRDKILDDKE
jgi:glucuronate isomerase